MSDKPQTESRLPQVLEKICQMDGWVLLDPAYFGADHIEARLRDREGA